MGEIIEQCVARCREIMRPCVVAVTPTTTVSAAARLMVQESLGSLPVVDTRGLLLGIVTNRDLVVRVCAEERDPTTTFIVEVMTEQPIACHADAPIQELEQLMIEHNVNRVFVTDDGARVVGTVTFLDLVHYEEPMRLAVLARNLSTRSIRWKPSHCSSWPPPQAQVAR